MDEGEKSEVADDMTSEVDVEARAVVVDRVDRVEARASVNSIRAQWRAALLPAKLLGEHTKLGRQAGVMWRELDVFEDRIKEAGGEEALMTLVCAHVSSSGSIEEFCDHYALDQGLLGAFISETPERMERFQNALRWLAEVDVSRTVPLADEATVEDVKVQALRIKTRFDRAERYAPERFGRKEAGLGAGLENLADVLTRISERKRAVLTVDVTDAEQL